MRMQLHLGQRDTGVTVEPDGAYPGMWRVRYPDGALSPMGNRTRAVDAAIYYARYGDRPQVVHNGLTRWERVP
jgi:hypothetical protein